MNSLQGAHMKQFLGEEFDAVISGVASFGFWAETIQHKCEGLVSVQSLLDYDDFRHDLLRMKKEVKSFINQFHPSFGYGATEIYFEYKK